MCRSMAITPRSLCTSAFFSFLLLLLLPKNASPLRLLYPIIQKNVQHHYYHWRLAAAMSTSIIESSDEPMTTRHLRLGQIFSKTGDYIFRVTKNMRFYSWTKIEIETLFSDLVDSMDQGDQRYELNQLLVLKEPQRPTTEDYTTDNNMLYIEPVWEVADGQQRLITLCLLYCAIRDGLPSNHKLRFVIQDQLIFEDYGKPPQPRIQLRQKHNSVLLQLLEDQTTILKKDPTGQRDEVQQRIVDNYYLLRGMVEERVKDSNPTFYDDFYVFLRDRVYVYLTIPENRSIARKLIGSARRGQDAEPIDELKAMCIFMGIQDEKAQDFYLDHWVKLEEEVSRKTFQDASLLIAQAALGRRCKRDGEIDILEDYWKVYEVGRDGAKFFDNVLAIGARKLHHFRNDMVPTSSSLSGGSLAVVRPQLVFLRDISAVTVAKPIEIAILSLLFIVTNNPDYVQDSISVLERIGLLFAVTKPALKDRYRRAFDISQAIQEEKPLDGFDLSRCESEDILNALDVTEWGASAQSRKAITAVLRRLEAEIVVRESESHIDLTNPSLEHILPQNPKRNSQWMADWTDMERVSWVNRLGNFCILNGRKNTKASNRDFHEKKGTYNSTLFPLTIMIAQLDQWTVAECERNHTRLMELCWKCFHLDKRLLGP